MRKDEKKEEEAVNGVSESIGSLERAMARQDACQGPWSVGMRGEGGREGGGHRQ